MGPFFFRLRPKKSHRDFFDLDQSAGGPKAAGASHDREPKRAHSRVLAFEKTTKIPRKDPPREGRKNENCGARGEKRSEILGGPAEGVPRREGPVEFGSGSGGGRGPAEKGSGGGEVRRMKGSGGRGRAEGVSEGWLGPRRVAPWGLGSLGV